MGIAANSGLKQYFNIIRHNPLIISLCILPGPYSMILEYDKINPHISAFLVNTS